MNAVNINRGEKRHKQAFVTDCVYLICNLPLPL